MVRMHHYQFAHMALRGYCASDPMSFFAVMASDRQRDFIREIWSKVCERCDSEETTDIVVDEIQAHCCRVAGYPTLLVEMPEAKFTAEAILVGVVLLADPEGQNAPEDELFRYFTLELGADLDGRHRTVLCEWRDVAHWNMGDGPEPNLGSFAEAVGKGLEATRE